MKPSNLGKLAFLFCSSAAFPAGAWADAQDPADAAKLPFNQAVAAVNPDPQADCQGQERKPQSHLTTFGNFSVLVDSGVPAIFPARATFGMKYQRQLKPGVKFYAGFRLDGRGALLTQARSFAENDTAVRDNVAAGIRQQLVAAHVPSSLIDGIIASKLDGAVAAVVNSRLTAQAAIDAVVREVYAGIKAGRFGAEIGKLDRVYNMADAANNAAFLSGPAVRGYFDATKNTTLYYQFSNDRGTAESSRGIFAGRMTDFLVRSQFNLGYAPNSSEGGVILMTPVGKIIAAVGSREGHSNYEVLNLRTRIAGTSMSATYSHEASDSASLYGAGATNRYGLLGSRRLPRGFTLAGEGYARRSDGPRLADFTSGSVLVSHPVKKKLNVSAGVQRSCADGFGCGNTYFGTAGMSWGNELHDIGPVIPTPAKP